MNGAETIAAPKIAAKDKTATLNFKITEKQLKQAHDRYESMKKSK